MEGGTDFISGFQIVVVTGAARAQSQLPLLLEPLSRLRPP